MKISTAIPTQILKAPLVKEQVKIASRFSNKLKQLIWVENHMALLLPKAKKSASDVKIKTAVNHILASIAERISSLEQAYAGIAGMAKKVSMSACEEFRLLTSDFDAILTIEDTSMCDAAIIFEIQKMVQFKIEHYSILCELADEFSNKHISRLAEKTLQSEICCDASLMDLSISYLGEYDISDIDLEAD